MREPPPPDDDAYACVVPLYKILVPYIVAVHVRSPTILRLHKTSNSIVIVIPPLAQNALRSRWSIYFKEVQVLSIGDLVGLP